LIGALPTVIVTWPWKPPDHEPAVLYVAAHAPPGGALDGGALDGGALDGGALDGDALDGDALEGDVLGPPTLAVNCHQFTLNR